MNDNYEKNTNSQINDKYVSLNTDGSVTTNTATQLTYMYTITLFRTTSRHVKSISSPEYSYTMCL